MNLREQTIKGLINKRNNLMNGKVNSIPSPFIRFRDDFIGIEQGTYYAITSFTKGGKSQFASYTFLYNSLLFAYTHQDVVRVTVLYFNLEESPERIMQRFMSYLLFLKTKGAMRYSPRDLRSAQNDKPVPQEVLDKLNESELTDIMDFFVEHVQFFEITNPTGIRKAIYDYANSHGKVETDTIITKDEFGMERTYEKFRSYIPDDPNEYVIPFIDTMNLVEPEKGMTVKQAMDETSKTLRKSRNRYNYSPVVIQQQAFDGEGVENLKMNKVRPSVAGLGDSKYIGRDKINIRLILLHSYNIICNFV